MNFLRYGVAIGLLAGLGACSDMMGNSGSASRTSAMTQPTVAPEMVKQVQSKLRDDGYYKQGSVDGVWGSGTESAVRSFQHDHNMTSSGQLDVPTLQALNLASTSPSAYNNNTPARATDSNPNPPPTQPMSTNPNPPADTTATSPPR